MYNLLAIQLCRGITNMGYPISLAGPLKMIPAQNLLALIEFSSLYWIFGKNPVLFEGWNTAHPLHTHGRSQCDNFTELLPEIFRSQPCIRPKILCVVPRNIGDLRVSPSPDSRNNYFDQRQVKGLSGQNEAASNYFKVFLE